MKKTIIVFILLIACLSIYFYFTNQTKEETGWSLMINNKIYLQMDDDDKIFNLINISNNNLVYKTQKESYNEFVKNNFKEITILSFFNLNNDQALEKISKIDKNQSYDLQKNGTLFLKERFFNVVPIPTINQSQFDSLKEKAIGNYLNLYYQKNVEKLIKEIKKDVHLEMRFILTFSNPMLMDLKELTNELKITIFWLRNNPTKELETYYDRLVEYGINKMKLDYEDEEFNRLVIEEDYKFKYIEDTKYLENYKYLINYHLIKDYEKNIKPKLNPSLGKDVEEKLKIIEEINEIIIGDQYRDYNSQLEMGIMNQVASIIDLISQEQSKYLGKKLVYPLCPQIIKMSKKLNLNNYQNEDVKITLNTLLNKCQVD